MDKTDISYDASALRTSGAASAKPANTVLTIAGRVVGAGLLLGMAWIHWRLYRMGFSSIHLIGPAFYANAVLGVVAAAAVLATPTRWLGAGAGGAALLDAGTLAALILSLTVGLLGYHETSDAPYIPATIIVELLGALVLAALAFLHREPVLRRLRGVV